MQTGNLFDGRRIVEDATLTPSDGTIAGSSAVIAGIEDRDVVLTLLNPNAATVQVMWAEHHAPYTWDTLGAATTTSQQIPIRLRAGFVYRLETTGGDCEAYMHKWPDGVYLGETYQGFAA